MKKFILIKDRIYGIYKITSPVIIELINSKPVQRLKKISQMGPPDKYYHLKGYSRFEHSVGVMLLLKHLGASEEEQIAGLIHDVSHTAFSHVIDWVWGKGHVEDYQDNQHQEILINSQIKKIIEKYDLDFIKIIRPENFSLLENNLPNVCADRIDYAIKEFPPKIAEKCFLNMTTINSQIVFKNKGSAKLFALNFLKRQTNHWSGYEAATRYVLLADILKRSLNKKIIKDKHLMNTDDFVINKIKKGHDKEIVNHLKILENKNLSFLKKSQKSYQKKFRYVDPYYLKDGKIFLLSRSDNGFKKTIIKAREKNMKGIKVGII